MANGKGLSSEVIYPALPLGIFLRFRCHFILRVLNPIVDHLAESGVEAVITSFFEYRYVCLFSCDFLRGKHGGQCTPGPTIVSVVRPTDGRNIAITLIDPRPGFQARVDSCLIRKLRIPNARIRNTKNNVYAGVKEQIPRGVIHRGMQIYLGQERLALRQPVCYAPRPEREKQRLWGMGVISPGNCDI
jgi:hypothetical protein